MYNTIIVIIDNSIEYIKLINISIGDESIANEYYSDNYEYINIKYNLSDKLYLNAIIGNFYSLYFINK